MEERLRALFFALLNHFREKLPHFSLEELHQLVLDALGSMNIDEGKTTWDDAKPATLIDCKRQVSLHRALRVPAAIAEIRDPVLIPVLGGRGTIIEVEAMSARFQDRSGQTMWSLDFPGSDLIRRVQRHFRQGGLAELLCVPIALPIAFDKKRPAQSLASARRGFFLHLVDFRPSGSVLHLVAATATERDSIDALRVKLAREGVTPSAYLEQLVVGGLKIAGLNEFPLLRSLIRFTVLQGLSSGRLDHAPARLHGLVVGPPGQGKKLIGLAARALNPICEQISPTKVSPAGLVGASHYTEGGWISQPGAIPRASGGVVLLQDAHGWNHSVVAKVAPILQEIMEDGEASDSVSGGIKRNAEAALLFDLNRTSQVLASGVAVAPASEAALLHVRPVLSRMDLLCEIPVDVERAWNVARQLYQSMKGNEHAFDDQPWVRSARLLVASLRDRHPKIELDPVRKHMERAHDTVHRANASLFAERPELGDVPARLAISFARFVTASARGRDASVASLRDVAMAESFIRMKLSFLAMTTTAWTPPSGHWRGSPAAWAGRYHGTEVSVSDVKTAYEQATGRTADERTFRRALIALGGVRRGRGRYLLPGQ